MSLLENAYEKYTLLDKVRTSDGLGGWTTTWTEGVEIMGAMVFNNSLQARQAQKMGVTSVYTLTTKKNVTLEYHDVLKRARDSKIFRVTSDGDDNYTPNTAGLDMRQVTCEEWTLPREDEYDQGTDNT